MTTLTTNKVNPVGNHRQTAWLLLLGLTLIGLLLRLPYWQTIPVAGDEVAQSVYALQITQGEAYPLVGNDAYAGPFYYYLLALLFKLGVNDPLVGRLVVLLTGTLLIPLTYGCATALLQNRSAALLAALLVAVNPYLVLVNSHPGGTTYLLPFFVMLFLWLLITAVNQDSIWWLSGAGVAAGLSIQANPLGALIVGMGLLWLLLHTRRLSRLGWHWPLWPIYAGILVVLVYSPVILFNLTTHLRTVGVLQERSYLWEANPTFYTFTNNIRRLTYQVIRQMSGVLTGDESWHTLIGWPLLYGVLMIGGVVHITRRISGLPAVLLTPFLIIFPYASSHYGFVEEARFTTMLLPILAICMGSLVMTWSVRSPLLLNRHQAWVVIGLVMIAWGGIAYPLLNLQQYYRAETAALQNGRSLLDVSRWIVAHNQGEPVYLSDIDKLSFMRDIPYVPAAYFIFNGVHHEFLPAEQIIGRLYTHPEPTILILVDEDVPTISQVAHLIPVENAATVTAQQHHYGVYRLDTAVPLSKPDFVITANAVPPHIAPRAQVGGTELLGCQSSTTVTPGSSLVLNCYWHVVDTIPENSYISFVHLYDPSAATLKAQDDHILGRALYPLNAWQPQDVVMDLYTIFIPPDTQPGVYELWVGIYTWPDLIRLPVPDNPDNVVRLSPITVNAEP